mmetsp:Transcript_7457/g.21758  ORF Transcript_7457/g.21758 Transcript_7457/m.21758 type:complete len:125 (+) Transcript_7457:1737-2111(+)
MTAWQPLTMLVRGSEDRHRIVGIVTERCRGEDHHEGMVRIQEINFGAVGNQSACFDVQQYRERAFRDRKRNGFRALQLRQQRLGLGRIGSIVSMVVAFSALLMLMLLMLMLMMLMLLMMLLLLR